MSKKETQKRDTGDRRLEREKSAREERLREMTKRKRDTGET
jgi:hypothetical protein